MRERERERGVAGILIEIVEGEIETERRGESEREGGAGISIEREGGESEREGGGERG